MTGSRTAVPVLGALLCLAGFSACSPSIKNTVFQTYEVQLTGPAPTYVGPALDPFFKTAKYRATVSYFEDAAGQVPYFQNHAKSSLFTDFTPVQTVELPGTGQNLALTPTGEDASLPRLSSTQTSVFVKAEIVGLDSTGKAIARARCPLQELRVLDAQTTPKVVCQAFYGFIGKWNEVRAPAISRVDFAAVALKDGRVVIGGGRVNDDNAAGQTDVDSVEVFQYPASIPPADVNSLGKWQKAPGALQEARSGLVAVFTPKSGYVLFLGGVSGGMPSTKIDRFETANTSLKAEKDVLANPIAQMGAALFDFNGTLDRVMMVGGVLSNAEPYLSPIAFEAGKIGQNLNAVTTAERHFPCVVALANQKVLACGGATADVRTNSCELISADSATTSGHLSTPRSDVKCAVTGPAGSESVYLVGGELGALTDASIEKWSGNSVSAIAATAPTALTKHALALSGTTVYVTGGYEPGSTQPLAAAFALDTTNDTVHALPSMLNPRAGHQLVALPDGNIMAIGGLSDSPLARAGAEILVPE